MGGDLARACMFFSLHRLRRTLLWWHRQLRDQRQGRFQLIKQQWRQGRPLNQQQGVTIKRQRWPEVNAISQLELQDAQQQLQLQPKAMINAIRWELQGQRAAHHHHQPRLSWAKKWPRWQLAQPKAMINAIRWELQGQWLVHHHHQP